MVQNKETGKRPYPVDIKVTDKGALKEWVSGCNIIHFHGDMTLIDPLGVWVRQFMAPRTMVIQHHYHERSLLDYRIRTRRLESFEHEIIAARKGAILDPGMDVAPVVVPLWRNELKPILRRRERLRLVFTPTSTERLMTYRGSKGKGYQETKAILDKMTGLDSNIITDLNWLETMQAVQEADIRLDECVTGGYGMATLEGLATGCLTINGGNEAVLGLLGDPPIFKADMSHLKWVIESICSMPYEKRLEVQKAGIEWMATHRNEHLMFDAYKNIYEKATEESGFSKQEIAQDYKKKVYAVTMTEFREDPPPLIMPNKGGKLIVQISRTNCAGAIWRIHDAINKYTPHTCRTITTSNRTNGRKFPQDVNIYDSVSVSALLKRADVIHFHNMVDHEAPEMRPYADLLRNKKKVLQYHTEPKLLQRNYKRDVVNRDDIKTLVIAQKHVRFYPRSTKVPNLVDINDPVLTPSNRKWEGGPLKVIYTPSDLNSYPDYSGTCCGKGYSDVMAVLRRLEKEGIIEATVITNQTWEELMPIKRQHDICIDECVTGGYHLCSLESLSQGLVTIAWLDDSTRKAINDISGNQEELPWINTRQAELYDRIKNLASTGADNIARIKRRGRQWMERYWDPKKLVEKFLEAYGLIDQKPNNGHLHRAWGNGTILPVYHVESKLLDEALALEGAWKDKQVVIWGNGGTVTQALEQRNDKWFDQAAHIGTNAAMLLKLNFNAYCIGDMRFVEKPEKAEIAVKASGVKIYQSVLRKVLPESAPVSYTKTIGNDGFSSDIRVGVYHGYSVVWLALQVALWGGAKDILLAGCPHDYTGEKPRFYREENPSHVDNNLHFILRNYSTLIPILKAAGIRVRTIGKSRLNDVGVEEMLTPGVY